MNREILFKAKRIDNGEWIEGSFLINTIESTGKIEKQYKIENITYGLFPNDFMSGVSEQVEPATVCQFTGLTDKNGVKIWENSILCYKGYKTPLYGVVKFEEFITDDSEQYIGFFVEWAPNGDGVKWADLRCDIGYWAVDNYTEVIGNRFDNPELIKEDK